MEAKKCHRACAAAATFATAKRGGRVTAATLICAASCLFVASVPANAQSLSLRQTIDLPSIHGRLDHLDIDVEGKRLFVAALAADALMVIDLQTGARPSQITSVHEPQGVRFMASDQRLYVANGAGGGVQAFVGRRLPMTAGNADLDDADNLRINAASGHLWVGYDHALAALDPHTLQVVQRVALQGHPEAFELDRSGQRVYVNVPSAGHIAVIDTASAKVAAIWKVDGASQNFAMALNEPNARLFVVTRKPALLLAYDTGTGQRVASVPVCGDVDDLFSDVARRRLYAVCGEGLVDVVQQRDADHYEVVEQVPTAAGARTGLFVPALSTLFVAAPARGGSTAQIRVYEVR
jgi:DNA-binding beta-propeller fold protein YncE